MIDFGIARRRMVDNQLRTINITDRRLLAAMGRVPRERFLPEARQALAYADTYHRLSADRVMPAPGPFAQLVQLAEVRSTDSVLDLGCGSGYSSAVLAALAKDVTAVEPEAQLAATAREALSELALETVTVEETPLDGAELGEAQFDVIIIEGAVTAVPEALFRLLAEDGRLVALIRAPGTAAVAHVFVRSGLEVTARAAFNTTLPPLALGPAEESFVF